MSAQMKFNSMGSVFYAGLGALAGVAAVMAAQWAWSAAFGAGSGEIAQSAAGSVNALLSQETRTMGLPLADGTKAFWYVARAGGILAYLLLWFATMWGIIMSSKMLKGVVDASLTFGLHEFFPMLAVFFAVIHSAVLLGDAYIDFGLTDVLVPFAASYRPLWTGLGTVALYLSIALIASFYLRTFVSRKVWRIFHYTSYLAVMLALVHGLQAGSDSSSSAMRWAYLLTGASLLFATVYRILTARAEAKPTAKTAAPPAANRPVRERAPRPEQRTQPAQLAVPIHAEAEQVL